MWGINKMSLNSIKELREKTSAGIMDCKEALKEANGDMEKAVDIIRKKGLDVAIKRAGRETTEGCIVSYVHTNNKLGVLVEVNCETDFVAKTDEFKNFSKDIAMQIAAMRPLGIKEEDISPYHVERERKIYKEQALDMGKPEKIVDKIVDGKMKKFYREACLLNQQYVKDNTVIIKDLLNEMLTKTGENIVIRRFTYYKIGE